MMNNNSGNGSCETKNNSGFLFMVVLYILLVIILGSSLGYSQYY